jgi:hypothetical protein
MKFGLIAVAAFVVVASAADAGQPIRARGVVTLSDAQAINSLTLRSLRLGDDLSEAGLGSLSRLRAGQDDGTTDCLIGLRDSITDVSNDLDALSTLAMVDSLMVDRRDEDTGLRFTRIQIPLTVKSLNSARSHVNKSAAECAGSPFISTKASVLLAFYDETLADIEALKQKIGE